ncbi:MAG: DoxX family protein [Gammaproteobacteria bacterium]|nr:MAG: DoxX family protein [Gammaproteobacteria bacterium]RLA43425.1 MAG: DoxX family protein [Gammaproteobacteria bacterium]
MNNSPSLVPDAVQQIAPLFGRILIAAIFIPAGFSKITGFAGVSGYMAAKGLPMPDLLLVLTIIIELGGGIMILIGWRATEAALVIALFLVPVTIIFHGFWGLEEIQKEVQMRMFMKNVGIMGGLLCIAGLGSGPLSLGGNKTG